MACYAHKKNCKVTMSSAEVRGASCVYLTQHHMCPNSTGQHHVLLGSEACRSHHDDGVCVFHAALGTPMCFKAKLAPVCLVQHHRPEKLQGCVIEEVTVNLHLLQTNGMSVLQRFNRLEI
eukprot:1156924-Pelagomonas_calceolata.AAC.16